MNLIGALVLVTNRQLVQIGGDVVGCATICIPVGVIAVVVHLRCPSRLDIGLVVLLEAMPADVSFMALLLAHLASQLGNRLSTSLGRRWRPSSTTTTIATAKATATTARDAAFTEELWPLLWLS